MIKILCDGLYKKDKSTWEQTRYSTCTLLNTQLKKPLKPNELMEFPWDKKDNKSDKLWFEGKKLTPQEAVKMFETMNNIDKLYHKNKK